MIPRMSGVSRFPSRRSSVSSLVTIAEDEIATAPPTTSASRSPRPNARPERDAGQPRSAARNTEPTIASAGRPRGGRAQRTRARGGTAASRARTWRAARGRPASRPKQIPGVCGPNAIPARTKSGIVGSSSPPPEPAEHAGEQRAPRRVRQRRLHQPTTSARGPARSSGRPITMIRSPGSSRSCGSGAIDRLRPRAHERDDGHPRAVPDLQSAMVRPAPGESSRSVTQSMRSPPTTDSTCSSAAGL